MGTSLAYGRRTAAVAVSPRLRHEESEQRGYRCLNPRTSCTTVLDTGRMPVVFSRHLSMYCSGRTNCMPASINIGSRMVFLNGASGPCANGVKKLSQCYREQLLAR